MGDKKPNKEKVLSELMFELEKGSDRAACLAKIVKKWQISTRTFDRHWKTANEAYKQRQESIQKTLTAKSTEAAIKRQNEAILTKEERMVIASKIARGEGWRVGKNVLAPSAGDRLRALDWLAKVEGDYMPKGGRPEPEDDSEAFEGFDSFMADCKKIELSEDEQ